MEGYSFFKERTSPIIIAAPARIASKPAAFVGKGAGVERRGAVVGKGIVVTVVTVVGGWVICVEGVAVVDFVVGVIVIWIVGFVVGRFALMSGFWS